MDHKNIRDTVQRRDTSVPVECGGKRVGPPRSSADDHYVLPVGDQAGVLDAATGMEIDPFKRRSSLQRTPPGRRGSVPDITTEDTANWPPLIMQQTAKRKRIENISMSDIGTVQDQTKSSQSSKILKIINSVALEAKALVKTARESTNTKKEIREISIKLLRLTEQLMGNEAQAILKNAMDGLDKTMQQDAEKHTDRQCLKTITCSRGTQTSETTVQCSATQTEDPEIITTQEIDAYISKGLNHESLKQLIYKKWGNDCFQKTTISRDNMQKVLDRRDLAIFMDVESAAENRIIQGIAARIPCISKLVEPNKLKPGKVICVANNSKIWMEDEEETETVNYTFLIGLRNEQDKEQEIYQLYLAAKKITEAMKHKGVTQITIIPSREWDQAQARKAIECAFRENNLDAYICTQPRTKGPTSAQAKKQGEAVVIDIGDRTFADLLKTVRKEVQEKGLSDSVGGARKTKSGNLLLTMEEKKGGATRVAEALKGINGVRALGGGQEADAVLHIKNIDAITSKQEVEAAVSEFIKNKGKKVGARVTSVRPDYGETQAATIIVSREIADSLLEAGKIRIGLANCRVRERVKVDSCYRCWEIGHIAKNCRGPDRTKLCIKCGEDNHQRKDCTKEPHCTLCNSAGHRPLTLSCPLYREEVRRHSRSNHKTRNGQINTD